MSRSRAISLREHGEIDKVTGFGSTKHGENLVDRKFLTGQCWAERPHFHREQAEVSAKVDLGHVCALAHLQTVEARSFPNAMNAESGLSERQLYQRNQEVDLSGRGAEEIKITSQPIDVAVGD